MFLKFHMRTYDSIHQQVEETFKKSQWFAWNLKVSIADSRSYCAGLFTSKNRKNCTTSSNETNSKLKVLPQRKNFGCEQWNSTTLISLAIDWTIISIHSPINKSRAHGSVSSRFAGSYGSEFLAMCFCNSAMPPKIHACRLTYLHTLLLSASLCR